MSDQSNSINETLTKVRALVNELIEEEVGAKDISFALAYVATEFGLHVTEGSVLVMPAVLTAVSQAIAGAGTKAEISEASPDSIEMPPQSLMTH